MDHGERCEILSQSRQTSPRPGRGHSIGLEGNNTLAGEIVTTAFIQSQSKSRCLSHNARSHLFEAGPSYILRKPLRQTAHIARKVDQNKECRNATETKPLSEQTIVITGATSGIGLCTARMAAHRGANAVAVARNEEALCELVDELNASGRSEHTPSPTSQTKKHLHVLRELRTSGSEVLTRG